MKFLADENIDQQIVQALRDRSHEVLYVAKWNEASTMISSPI